MSFGGLVAVSGLLAYNVSFPLSWLTPSRVQLTLLSVCFICKDLASLSRTRTFRGWRGRLLMQEDPHQQVVVSISVEDNVSQNRILFAV